MTTATYHRRVGKTGRPLGLLDVLSKIIETAGEGVQSWLAARRETQLAHERDAARESALRDAAAVRRMADQYRVCAPGYAADLYAAADQHELKFER